MFNRSPMRRCARGFYWWLQNIRRRFLGTRVDEAIWKKKSYSHVKKNLGNVLLPHRVWLSEKILSHLEIMSQINEAQVHNSVLEIGCGCGANLEVITRSRPSLRLVGVDISQASIAAGRERFAKLGLGGITLFEGQADNLSAFADDSVDIVFTDAMLLYIGPDKIQICIEEMRRIARLEIILLEMHIDGVGMDGSYTLDGWVRDYRVLFHQLGNEANLVRMPPEKRQAGRWPKYGTLIEVRLQNYLTGDRTNPFKIK